MMFADIDLTSLGETLASYGGWGTVVLIIAGIFVKYAYAKGWLKTKVILPVVDTTNKDNLLMQLLATITNETDVTKIPAELINKIGDDWDEIVAKLTAHYTSQVSLLTLGTPPAVSNAVLTDKGVVTK